MLTWKRWVSYRTPLSSYDSILPTQRSQTNNFHDVDGPHAALNEQRAWIWIRRIMPWIDGDIIVYGRVDVYAIVVGLNQEMHHSTRTPIFGQHYSIWAFDGPSSGNDRFTLYKSILIPWAQSKVCRQFRMFYIYHKIETAFFYRHRPSGYWILD